MLIVVNYAVTTIVFYLIIQKVDSSKGILRNYLSSIICRVMERHYQQYNISKSCKRSSCQVFSLVELNLYRLIIYIGTKYHAKLPHCE